jgi:hypothetical protein
MLTTVMMRGGVVMSWKCSGDAAAVVVAEVTKTFIGSCWSSKKMSTPRITARCSTSATDELTLGEGG